jgi:hypothetical protein
VTVKPGGLLEIRRSDLPAGATVEVILMIDEGDEGNSPNAPQTFASLFGAVRDCFGSGEAADAFLRSERDAWLR